MLLRFMLMYGALCLGFGILTCINFWQIGHVGQKALAGYTFDSLWTFWGAYGVLAAPAVVFANILFWSVYYFGYHFWFNKVWIIQISTFSAGLIMMALITWLWFGKLVESSPTSVE